MSFTLNKRRNSESVGITHDKYVTGDGNTKLSGVFMRLSVVFKNNPRSVKWIVLEANLLSPWLLLPE